MEGIWMTTAMLAMLAVAWSITGGLVTYAWMNRHIGGLNYTIESMDWYIYQSDNERASLLDQLEWYDREYGDLIDDYEQHHEYDPAETYTLTEKGREEVMKWL